MLRKSWLSLLESTKTQYLAIYKESKEYMFSVSYSPFSVLLTRYLLLSAIKSKLGGRLNFQKLTKICTFARDCVTRQLD